MKFSLKKWSFWGIGTGSGLFAGWLATCSVCCALPFLAVLGLGSLGISLTDWILPFKPYLLTFSILVLGFSVYQLLKQRKAALACDDASCGCSGENKHGKPGLFLPVLLMTLPLLGMLWFAPPASLTGSADNNCATSAATCANDVSSTCVANKSDCNKTTNCGENRCSAPAVTYFNATILDNCETSCEAPMQNALKALPGVLSCNVDPENQNVTIAFDRDIAKEDVIIERLTAGGCQIVAL